MTDQQLYERLVIHLETLIGKAQNELAYHKRVFSAGYDSDCQKTIHHADGVKNFYNLLLNSKIITNAPEQRTRLDELDNQLNAIEDELREAVRR